MAVGLAAGAGAGEGDTVHEEAASGYGYVVAGRLGLVHHGVGGAEYLLDSDAVFREGCEAEASGE